MKHLNGPDCLRCNEMLKGAHPVLKVWALRVRELYPNAHFFTIWRGEEDQNKMVASGKSERKWPFSRHNAVDKDGNPCSEAMDIFRLNDSGGAEFPNLWYLQIADALDQEYAPIEWGGNWKHFIDLVHFQLKEIA